MIKVICFDAAGTLIHLPKGVAHHYQLVAKRHGIELNEQELAAAFRAAWKNAPARAAIGIARSDDDKGWWKVLVADVLTQCRALPSPADFDGLFEELYDHFTLPGVWELYPDVVPVLDALAGRYRLGVISNFDRRLLVILEQLGIREHFPAIVLSSETGADKPAPEIFHRALTQLDAGPQNALHVGDDPYRDWHGAAAAGMHCFQLDRTRNSLREVPAFADSL